MKIKNVAIEAFRCFDYQSLDFEREDGRLANLIVLYAPNGFGKTSLFDAIEYGVTRSVNRFTKGVYDKDNRVDKKFRKKHSFLFNKNVDTKRNIRVSVHFDGTFKDIDHTFSVAEENLYSAKASKYNDFFKDVILSQEWFDYFIRSTTPEERCNIFFEYFGRRDDLLTYNKELEDVRTELKSFRKSKEEEVKKLSEGLKAEVKGDALHLLQKGLEQYAETGWNLPSYDSINAESIKALYIWIETKTDDIKHVLLVNESRLATISSILNGNSIFATISDLRNDQIRLSDIKEHLQSIKKYRDKQDRLFLILKEQDENIEMKDRIDKEKNVYNYYIANEKKISDLLCRLYRLSEDKRHKEQIVKNVQKKLAVLYKDMEDIQQQIPDVEGNFRAITPVYDNLRTYYDQYRERIVKKEDNAQKLKTSKSHLVQLQVNNKELAASIKVIEAFRKDMEKGIDESLLVQNLYGAQLLAMLDEKKELVEIEKAKSELDNKKKGHELYKSEVQRLVDNSRTIYSEFKNGVCPLCGYDWESIEGLINNIENNHAIDDTLFNLSKQYEEQEKKAKTVRERISDKKNELQETIRYDILAKQEQMSLNDKQIESLAKEICKIEDEMENLEIDIAKYSGRFGDREYEQVKDKIDEEYNDAQRAFSNIKKKETELKNGIEEEEKRLQELQYDIKKLASEYESIQFDDFYQKTKVCYKLLNCSLDQKIVEYWKDRSNALSKTLNKVEMSQKGITAEIEEIHNLGINEFDKKSKEDELERLSAEHESVLQTLNKKVVYINKLTKENISIEDTVEKVEECLRQEIDSLKQDQGIQNKLLGELTSFSNLVKNSEEYLGYNTSLKEIDKKKKIIDELDNKLDVLNKEKERLSTYVKTYIDNFFDKMLINKLYNTIDPHPKYKHINFDCDFEKQNPRLCVKMATANGVADEIVPNLYFSSAQINILSFCIFMAKALNAKDDNGEDVNCIFIDDPIQAMDDINVLSVVDLLRNVAFANDKQVLITTHDRNFYELLKKKCPAYIFNSKYFKFLEKGVIVEDD